MKQNAAFVKKSPFDWNLVHFSTVRATILLILYKEKTENAKFLVKDFLEEKLKKESIYTENKCIKTFQISFFFSFWWSHIPFHGTRLQTP